MEKYVRTMISLRCLCRHWSFAWKTVKPEKLEAFLRRQIIHYWSKQKFCMWLFVIYNICTPCCYRGLYCIEKSCKALKDHALKRINYKKKKIILLAYEKIISYLDQTDYHMRRKDFWGNQKSTLKFDVIVVMLINTDVLNILICCFR